MAGHELINVQKEMEMLWSLLCQSVPTGAAVPGRSRPIQDFLYFSITNSNTPADVRRQLWGNIVLSGGFSALAGFGSFLEKNAKPPGNYSAKVLPVRHRLIGGSNTVWAGGSILGSLDTFPDFCITKQEWQEHGARILQEKCC
jgi:actin-related protein